MKDLSECTVLVVDDGETNIDILLDILGEDYDVTVALDGESALEAVAEEIPDLILADIQLADKSSGIDAVNTLLEKLGERPVIFITAFPERLLTGERPEPAFLITKPYSEEQVRAAVSQAMFFSSTETLAA